MPHSKANDRFSHPNLLLDWRHKEKEIMQLCLSPRDAASRLSQYSRRIRLLFKAPFVGMLIAGMLSSPMLLAQASGDTTAPSSSCPNPGACFLSQSAQDAWAAEQDCGFPTEPGVETGLGAAVDALVEKSPTLKRHIEQLLMNDWVIVYGQVGAGDSTTIDGTKIITIDGRYRGDLTATLSGLAHEVGHATFTVVEDTSSKEAYVSAYLEGEGAATLLGIRVQREIIANGGPDIGLRADTSNHAFYNSVYDQYLVDGNAELARSTIGEHYGNHEVASVKSDGAVVTYAEFYGDHYDKHYGSD